MRPPYFRHKAEDNNPCTYYTHPSESQIHKDAKLLFKQLMDNQTTISLIRSCSECKSTVWYLADSKCKDSTIVLEHSFIYVGSRKVADIAHLADGKIKAIFEIYNAHKTQDNDRPEPWYEISATELTEEIAKTGCNITSILLKCTRSYICKGCIIQKALRKKQAIDERKNRVAEEARRNTCTN